MYIYVIYNEHTNKYWAKSKSDQRGYAWVDFDKATQFRGENARGPAYSQRRGLLNEQGYAKIVVKKYALTEVKDV